jgi:hypothetical protein
MVVNFLHAYGRNYFVAIVKNAWVGSLVCLCVIKNRICNELWMVEGATALKRDLRNLTIKGKIKRQNEGVRQHVFLV